MRTITVKGIGHVSAKPNWVVITMDLEVVNGDYESAMNLAADKVRDISLYLKDVGFDKESIKTTSFNVDRRYESEKDERGHYKRVFKGYACLQSLKIEFDLDVKRLSAVLNAISRSYAKPEWNIRFTVKDVGAVNAELLRAATKNAKEKALVLCESADVGLGELISIDYNWGELDIFSHTQFDMEDKCLAMEASRTMDIEPEDIEVTDTVTFVWEIK